MTKKIFMALSMIVVFAVSGSVVYGYNGGHNGGGHGNGNGHGNGCGGRNNGGGRGHGNGSYDRNDGYGHRNGGNGSYYYDNMTAEDKAKYDALYEEYTPKMNTLRDQMIDQKNIINSEYSKTAPNLDAINNAIDESSKLSAEMRKLRAAHSIEMQKLFPDNNNRNYRRLKS